MERLKRPYSLHSHLLPTWGAWKLRDLTAKRLDAWVINLHRRSELTPATINKLIQALRTILELSLIHI